MSFEKLMDSMPKKKKAKKVEPKKEVITKTISKVIEKPISPIIKVIEQPNFSPVIIKQGEETKKLAEQAIASMRDTVNNNQAIMGEIINILSVRPKEFIIQKDGKGDMAKIIPVYDDGR